MTSVVDGLERLQYKLYRNNFGRSESATHRRANFRPIWTVLRRWLIQRIELGFQFRELRVFVFHRFRRQFAEWLLARNLFQQSLFGHLLVSAECHAQI